MKRIILYYGMTFLSFVLVVKTLIDEGPWWTLAFYYLGFIGFLCTSVTLLYNSIKKEKSSNEFE